MVEVLSTPADPKQARSKQTKEKIVQAAIQLFEERGFEGTTSNEIAAAAGVSVGSFYVYFTDKRQLLLTIFDRLADEMFKNIFEIVKPEYLFDSKLRPAIRDAVARNIEDKQRHAGLHRVISELVLKDEEFADRRKAVLQRSISKLEELISLANKAGLTWDIDVEAAAFVVNRVCFNLSQDYVTGSCDFDMDRAIDALSDMILRYLFKPKA
ncbi:MAG TPA: TetR/AcrR family transcriptional regulator [Blastocatellia bacterium]|jgi:AcrR family transcriptional regulator|nr:TetR/AcrR family transcriptional regulator [Blastocatellia bacterium]